MYSAYIKRITLVLKAFGWSVEPFSTNLPDNISGRCDYDNKIIHINCASADNALKTLAHETGHALAFCRAGNNYLSLSKQNRETRAYLLGWAVLKFFDCPITKQSYKDHHKELLEGKCRKKQPS